MNGIGLVSIDDAFSFRNSVFYEVVGGGTYIHIINEWKWIDELSADEDFGGADDDAVVEDLDVEIKDEGMNVGGNLQPAETLSDSRSLVELLIIDRVFSIMIRPVKASLNKGTIFFVKFSEQVGNPKYFDLLILDMKPAGESMTSIAALVPEIMNN
ncbi:hypothetical protein INT45_012178 [Circinella minor]|uniref:Uncharacterized protein n=1 Tax=Circinella minor TaxID=1195481 RepID=A0A8H7SCH6_9FUNG|nr:hypothetical protein INT45_012178 [Circinella minor]